MCRHVAHLGPPAALYDALFGAPHSLCQQARHPRHQRQGSENPAGRNPDGWGVGWYVEGSAAPERYRTVTPVWDDHEFADRAHSIETGAFLAAARWASPGSAIDVRGNAPFTDGRRLFSLNGSVDRFHEGVGDELRATLSPGRVAALESDTDSEVLFAMVLDRLDAGSTAAEALTAVVDDVLSRTSGWINLLLTDGDAIAATRRGRSLFVRGTTIASEPLDDDPGWTEVPNQSTIEVR